jgi:putative ABC transport system permease protein
MGNLLRDVRFAWRKLTGRPGFTLAAVLTLALGIGPTAVLFSAMGGVLVRPLPFERPEELVWIWEITPQGRRSTTSAATFLDWRRASQSFSQMAAYDFLGFQLGGMERPEMVTGAAASANLFEVLGVPPALGRSFRAEEEQPGQGGVAVISHRMWQRQFSGRPDALGQKLTLNDQPYTVIGVLPQNFWLFLDNLDVFVPLSWDPAILADRANRGYDVIARPRRGVLLAQAQQEMDRVAAHLAATHPTVSEGWRAGLQPVQAHYLEYYRPAMRVMLLAVGGVLLITCSNIANLLLAHGLARRREFAIRLAVGARASALTRMVVLESTLLALAGAALAVLLTAWTRGALIAILPGELQRRLPGGVAGVGVDGGLIALMLVVAVGCGLLMGLLPAWQAARSDPGEALKQGGSVFTGGGRGIRNALVACQVGLATVALVAGALLAQGYREASRADLGFRAEGVLHVGLSLSAARYPTEAHRVLTYDRVLEQVASLPGVDSAALASGLLPPPNALGGPFRIEGRPLAAPGESPTANLRLVSSNYFAQMRIPIVEGRPFTVADGHGAPGVAVLSRVVADAYWPQGGAVGQRIRLGAREGQGDWLTVVGVASDVRHPLDPKGARILYRPIAQAPARFASLLVQVGGGEPEAVRGSVEKAVWGLDSEMRLWGVAPLEGMLAEELAHVRFTTTLVSLFAALAVALAALGVLGCSAYAVSRQTREFGVRMALGAHPRDIRWLVVRQGLQPVLWGGVVGLAVAVVVARMPLLTSQIHTVSANRVTVYVACALLMAIAALVGCLWPARRASRVDPMAALRYE